MRLDTLFVDGFKKLAFDQPIHFAVGMIPITGLNEAGKSTVLDAILYALFGRVLRPSGRPRKEDLIGYRRTSAVVELTFTISGRQFKVQRKLSSRSRSTALLDEVLPEGRTRPIAADFERVTEEVQRLLGGITLEEVRASNVVGQKQLDYLVKEGATKRKEVINVFLNLEDFNAVHEKLDEGRRELAGTPGRPGTVDLAAAELERLQHELSEYQRRQTELEQETRRQVEAEEQLTLLVPQLKEAQQRRDGLEAYDTILRQWQDRDAKVRSATERLTALRNTRNRLQTQMAELQTQLQAFAVLEQLRPTIDELHRLLQQADEGRRNLQIQATETQQLRSQANDLTTKVPQFPSIDRAKRAARYTWPRLGTGILLAAASVFLFTAGLPVPGAALLATGIVLATWGARGLQQRGIVIRYEGFAQLRDTLQTTQAKLAGAVARERTTATALQRLLQRVQTLSATLQDRYPTQLADPVAATVQLLEQYDREAAKRGQLISSIQTLGQTLSREAPPEALAQLETELVRVTKERDDLVFPTLPAELSYSEETLRQAREHYTLLTNLHTQWKTTRDEAARNIQAHQRYLEQHAQIEPQVEAQRRKTEELRRQLAIVTRALNGLDATTQALRDRVRPMVEHYIGRILPHITNGRYQAAQLDDDYNLLVFDPDAGEYRPRDIFSGGTDDQFLLAMRLAFALALLPQSRVRPRFLFLDEPFGSADEIRRTGIIEYLANHLRQDFDQIFVISHVPGLEDLPGIRIEDGRVISP